MEMLENTSDFIALQERLRYGLDPNQPLIVISAGTCGQASGANDLIRVTKRELIYRGLAERVRLRITGCHGYCQAEPSVLIEPHRWFYPNVTPEQMAEIVGATASGATTYALGKAAGHYFGRRRLGERIDPATLRRIYADAMASGARLLSADDPGPSPAGNDPRARSDPPET